jgi:hypothetical protein
MRPNREFTENTSATIFVCINVEMSSNFFPEACLSWLFDSHHTNPSFFEDSSSAVFVGTCSVILTIAHSSIDAVLVDERDELAWVWMMVLEYQHSGFEFVE